jgi:hypothetical protein
MTTRHTESTSQARTLSPVLEPAAEAILPNIAGVIGTRRVKCWFEPTAAATFNTVVRVLLLRCCEVEAHALGGIATPRSAGFSVRQRLGCDVHAGGEVVYLHAGEPPDGIVARRTVSCRKEDQEQGVTEEHRSLADFAAEARNEDQQPQQ